MRFFELAASFSLIAADQHGSRRAPLDLYVPALGKALHFAMRVPEVTRIGLVLTVLVAVAHPTTTQAQRRLSYEPQIVELNGRLVIQSKYGPPNYGEQPKTDQKVKVPVLVLKNPVSVLPSQEDGYNSQPVYRTTQIQLAFTDSRIVYKNLIGKNVVVTGSLFHAHTGHHYTDVVLSVRSIKRRSAGSARRRETTERSFNWEPNYCRKRNNLSRV